MKQAAALVGLVLALALAPHAAHAEVPIADTTHVLASGAAALERGALREALETYETFADRGERDPDVSYSRGVAYLARARNAEERPGDLGRAAAAFEECMALRPNDADAATALEAVRAEVARRRARGGEPIEIDTSPGPTRVLVGLLPEATWALLAAAGSIALTVGLLARRARAATIRLAGGIACALGGLALVAFGAAAALARSYRVTATAAIVIVPEARLVDLHGAPATGAAIPEAARVEVLERRGALARVRWGKEEGWTHYSNVLPIRVD